LPEKGDLVPNDENIVRYAPPSKVDNDTIDGSAFVLRADDAGELSVNVIGADPAAHPAALENVRVASRLTLKANGRFAQLSVSDVRSLTVAEVAFDPLEVIYDPLAAEGGFPADPTHSEILNLPDVGSEFALLVGDLLALWVRRTHLAIIT
jgi:hypothetical protein